MAACTVWGPTCDGIDCVIADAHLPELEVGDWLYFSLFKVQGWVGDALPLPAYMHMHMYLSPQSLADSSSRSFPRAISSKKRNAERYLSPPQNAVILYLRVLPPKLCQNCRHRCHSPRPSPGATQPVPGCTPCCDRRRASGSLRGSRRIWHNRIAGLSAAERAAAGRLHAYCAPATPKTSPRHARPILCF